MKMTDEEREKKEEELLPRLTPEFLATLLEAYRVCGWSVDATEIREFVKWVYETADVPRPAQPELEVYTDS